MDIIDLLLIVFVFVVVITLVHLFASYDKDAVLKKEEKQKKAEERKKRIEMRKEAWAKEIMERESQFGKLTKTINFTIGEEDQIYVYEKGRVVFIYNERYSFDDIISCKIETKTIRGAEKHITKPDEYELAEEQILWGMGKKYNVKTTTQVLREPDRTTYTVYVGINSIATPQVGLNLGSNASKANEINSLMNAIIHSNSKE
ncbi:hypothetical protein D0T50_06220 [Bacteroides sp. 214]|uniref:hypothetical protein n=1 Tax=Bacteroides sp. 214 TaxID=2302935 RepID=UPI0013D69EFC|nr:hypothetical protein [Bacteroides sp. 214]NDW12485.1 hypothetical protein [Bacteroides sp. 214]